MAQIKSIAVETIDYRHFVTRTAVVETESGERWKYTLDYNNRTWNDEEDYIDNAKSDFASEAEFGIEDTELFYKEV